MEKDKKYFEEKRKSVMRMLLILWLFAHMGLLALYFTLNFGVLINFGTTVNSVFATIFIVLGVFLVCSINYLLIATGISKFNLDDSQKILSEKLKKSKKDFKDYSGKYDKASTNNLLVDEWILLAPYGDSQDKITRKLKKSTDNEKKKIEEFENEIQIFKEMDYRTFWSYLKSFKWL
ncbi:MAG TPA: hypothetical protein P5060_02585 [Candidatus Absconditabacterales bacterium]|nr:hypothetical protein [Candidatus Absconditabacterales bacterium]